MGPSLTARSPNKFRCAVVFHGSSSGTLHGAPARRSRETSVNCVSCQRLVAVSCDSCIASPLEKVQFQIPSLTTVTCSAYFPLVTRQRNWREARHDEQKDVHLKSEYHVSALRNSSKSTSADVPSLNVKCPQRVWRSPTLFSLHLFTEVKVQLVRFKLNHRRRQVTWRQSKIQRTPLRH